MAIEPGSFAEASKNISKIIAKSWLDDEEGRRIRNGLLNPDTVKQTLESGINGQYGVNLNTLFDPICVTVRVYGQGETMPANSSIQPIPDANGGIVVNIPLPEKPQGLEDELINTWIDNDDPNTVYPSPPIPAIST